MRCHLHHMLLTAYLGLRSLGVGGCLLLTAYCLLATVPSLAITQPPRLPQGRPERTTDYRLQTTSNAPLPTANSPLSTDSISYDRYAVIETRMPFGDESAAAALAAAAAVASQPVVESFTKVLKMCAITRNRFNGKVQVGIVNTLTKKNYFLYEGDTEDGMELVKADYESEKALVRKGAEEVWMDMTAIVASATPVVSPAPGGGFARRAMAPPPAPAPAPGPAQPDKPRLTGEALKEHLKNYQMDLIRAGGKKGPPLPMALTPEMDAKLVEEGVLPSVE